MKVMNFGSDYAFQDSLKKNSEPVISHDGLVPELKKEENVENRVHREGTEEMGSTVTTKKSEEIEKAEETKKTEEKDKREKKIRSKTPKL